MQDMAFLGRRGVSKLIHAACKLAHSLESPKVLSWHACASDQQAGMRHANAFLHYLMDSGAYAPARLASGQRRKGCLPGDRPDSAHSARAALMQAPGLRAPLLQAFDRREVEDAWQKATATQQVGLDSTSACSLACDTRAWMVHVHIWRKFRNVRCTEASCQCGRKISEVPLLPVTHSCGMHM